MDGHLVVADLGLSRCFFKSDMLSQIERNTLPDGMRCDVTEQTQMFCGTPSYLAPEIILEKEYSYPVDVWSFGVIVFQFFFGRLPFDAPPRAGTEALFDAIVRGTPAITHAESRVFPDFVQDFIASALDTNPDTRYTPEQLRAHELFENFDWDLHASSPVPNWPNPEPAPLSSLKEVTGPLLNEMRLPGSSDVFTGNHFSFLSSALQELSSTPSPELSSGEASPSPSPEHLGSPIGTSPSTTFVADTPNVSAKL
ncbi:hypothetical protein NLI96_g5466 [Meripilus lineatus]|uniref:non-specific serine/threonine protein kinase n=1 Tax=Meripilus lineatus TaxID=2056292 RepID=A0AAD5YES9_9APHY|nr:hypothetical protein NLI96_g5466 [Physisporinus lineatus]